MGSSGNRSRIIKRANSLLVAFGQVSAQAVPAPQSSRARRQTALAITLVLTLTLFVAAVELLQRFGDDSENGPRTSILTTLANEPEPNPRTPDAPPAVSSWGDSSSGNGVVVSSDEPQEQTPLTLALTPQSETSAIEDGAMYFPETGHSLTLFRDFWQRSHGERVFGPPLTETFRDDGGRRGQSITVQYFATQRIEHHPEMEGTPFEFLLGRLGYEDAQRRGLLTTQPFDPLPLSTGSTDDCQVFQRTRHSVCGEFLNFWQENGLDLGDPGISQRESIALFGYPISEEFESNSSGLLVQYFERARLEQNPNAGEGEPVLVAWLGADSLAQRLSEK